MKALQLYIVLIIICNQNIFTQDYGTYPYPIALGNVWVYRDGYMRRAERIEIVGKDILINNSLYFDTNIMEYQGSKDHYRYVRIREDNFATSFDSTYGVFPGEDYLYYKTSPEIGDYWNQYSTFLTFTLHHTVVDTGNYLIFQGSTKYYEIFQTDSGLAYNFYLWSEKYGIIVRSTDDWQGNNRLYLWGCVIDGVVYGDTSFTVTSVEEDPRYNLNNFHLAQNYPNPFNPSTTISFSIPERTNVMLKVINSLGEEVAVLVNVEKDSGSYSVEFRSTGLPSGIYIYRMQSGNFVSSKKMLLIK